MTLTDLLPATPDPDAVFDAFAGWSKRRGLALYPHQEEALIEIVSGANVILSTPTGSGVVCLLACKPQIMPSSHTL